MIFSVTFDTIFYHNKKLVNDVLANLHGKVIILVYAGVILFANEFEAIACLEASKFMIKKLNIFLPLRPMLLVRRLNLHLSPVVALFSIPSPPMSIKKMLWTVNSH